ncbi:hypothetical protein LAZ67_6003150 [Cordylochernes scorpioides]|uniref:Histone-lysine N-methyltransferase SETMAR n=1 Tax=Cordylochernes scorpioides TaxID=51811 RepID=A0ABY6KNY3_9ARAC|nr:hypothetical protein LAZ67_6003150 [Cordylochernes scorpioides]
MDIRNVRKWCREFNEGRINVHDEQRSGRPSLPESTVARIDEMVRSNRRITLEEIEDGLNEDCSHFSVHKIVSETLGYRKVSARFFGRRRQAANNFIEVTSFYKLYMERLPRQQDDHQRPSLLTEQSSHNFFKDDCISRSQSGKWHKAFKKGREEVADEPRSGRPTTARTDKNVDRVLEVLRTDR